jgi:hypothetical protein
LNQERIKHPNRAIESNQIEAAVKSLPTKKSPGPDVGIAEFYQTFKEELTSVLPRLIHKIEKEVSPQIHSMKVLLP